MSELRDRQPALCPRSARVCRARTPRTAPRPLKPHPVPEPAQGQLPAQWLCHSVTKNGRDSAEVVTMDNQTTKAFTGRLLILP